MDLVDKIPANILIMIGESEAWQYVLYRIEKVARTNTTVLILGETGTGKELVAEAIHHGGSRKHKPLVKVNCAALPTELIENELFGHEKGAFTGAYTRKRGKFLLANGGTLFLDEIGELPLNLQAKILRSIESGEIEPIGGTQFVKSDVRIIAATNRNLEEEIQSGNFRKDLYFRLNVYPISLPPLRHRKEDIKALIWHFIRIFNTKLGRSVNNLSEETLNLLLSYHWPGNVRELENVIERSMILSEGTDLQIELPESITIVESSTTTLDEALKKVILKALHISKGKISGTSGAASFLKVNPSTLRSKIKKLGIDKEIEKFST